MTSISQLLSKSSSAEQLELLRLAKQIQASRHPKPSLRYSPHTPLPQQRKWLDAMRVPQYTREGKPKASEALYGGAAGGGKSDALLMAALEYVHVPGYSALILRKSFEDLALPGAIMDRAQDWLRPTDAQIHDGGKSWSFPGGGSLTFGYMQTDADRYRYQGAEFQFVGFDELTQFGNVGYRYLLSRCRRPAEGPLSEVPLRAGSASNPGGVGHEWVKQRFLTEGRIFVPAKLSDNPHLDQESYRAQLAELDPVTRRQLEEGDWGAVPEGEMFKRPWFQLMEDYPTHRDWRWCRYWDLAATAPKKGRDPDWTVGALVGLLHGEWWIADIQRTRDTPKAIEDLVRHTAELDGPAIPIRMEQEPGSSGVNVIDHYGREVLVGRDFLGDKKTGDKLTLAKPLSAAAQRGHVRVLKRMWTGRFLDEVVSFPTEGIHDDQVDAVSGAMRHIAQLGDTSPASWPGEALRAARRAVEEEDEDMHSGARRF